MKRQKYELACKGELMAGFNGRNKSRKWLGHIYKKVQTTTYNVLNGYKFKELMEQEDQ